MGATAIRAEGLTKRYSDVAALDHLDLQVVPGEVLGYLGPNGAVRPRRSVCCWV
jgi:ABC-2 type transport system ATP-binding protein